MAVGDDRNGSFSTTCGIGAITDTVAKVWLGAKTGGIRGRASKFFGFGKHVADTGLTTWWEIGEGLSDGSSCESADGEDN